MSDRGVTLLQLCDLPPGSAARDEAWAALGASERSNQTLLRDYARRRFVTTAAYQTAELTSMGKVRLTEGLELRARR